MSRAQPHLQFVLFAQYEADPSHSMQEFSLKLPVDFPAQAHHLCIDDIVERSLSGGLFPNVTSQHLPRNHAAPVGKKVLEQLELTSR